MIMNDTNKKIEQCKEKLTALINDLENYSADPHSLDFTDKVFIFSY